MPLGKTFEEYRAEVFEYDPSLEGDLRKASAQLELGIALNRLREARGLSQRALAQLTGIKQPMIVRIERGSQSPGIETIAKILRALNGALEISPDGMIAARVMQDPASPALIMERRAAEEPVPYDAGGAEDQARS